MQLSIKYHVPSRGILEKNQIWRIYRNVDQGWADTEYVEHVKLEGVESWTGNNMHRVGFSLLTEGELTVCKDPVTGLKMGVIHPPGAKVEYELWEE